MKAQIIATALFASVASAFAADGWLTNLEEAQKKAAAENKPILIEFTGSDWCPPCKMLQKNVFSTETFSSQAPEKFILVEMDYPRAPKDLSKETQAYRQSVATKYDITGFPTIVLTDATGKPLGRTGFLPGDAANYLKHLDELLAESNKEQKAFKEAHALEGHAKATALVALLNDKPASEIKNFYQPEVAAIKAADPSDKLLFAKKQEDHAAFAGLMESLDTLAAEEKWDEVATNVDTFLGRKALTTELHQQGLLLKAQLKFFKLNAKDEALKLLDEVVKLDETTQVARQAQQIKAHIESQESK